MEEVSLERRGCALVVVIRNRASKQARKQAQVAALRWGV